MPRDRRLSVGLGYRSRWGSDFEREPLHVYTEKERERAKELIQQAARQKYGTDMPPVPRVQRTAGVTEGGQAFEGRAMAAPSQKTAPKPKEDKKGGGGLWGKIKAFGEDVLDVIDAPAKYVGKPVFGVVSGLT